MPSGSATMEKYRVVPDVIPVAPRDVISVRFPSGVEANMGEELTPTQVKDRPEVSWPADDSALYTLVMTDPDAPAEVAEARHWLMVNIPGSRLADGDDVSEYIGSGAPKGTGLHRYIFLAYKQPGKITVDPALRVTKFQRGTRLSWSVRKFAEEHGLGDPAAGNFFRAQYDDYVPLLHAQLAQGSK